VKKNGDDKMIKELNFWVNLNIIH